MAARHREKCCVIRARMASSRLPGKPLIDMPLIQHVCLRSRLHADFECGYRAKIACLTSPADVFAANQRPCVETEAG